MATPNFYILNINGVLTPGNLQGTDVASSLGLDIAPDTIGQYIADVPTLSSDLTTLSSDVGTLSSEVSTIQGDLKSIGKSIGDLQTLAGTTAGNVYYSENQVGVQKRLILSFDGYANESDVNQSITFPVAFTYVPIATSNINGLSFTVSATELTITAPNAATAFSGTITIDGQ